MTAKLLLLVQLLCLVCCSDYANSKSSILHGNTEVTPITVNYNTRLIELLGDGASLLFMGDLYLGVKRASQSSCLRLQRISQQLTSIYSAELCV